jgi:predicted nucleic acid-binding protein
VVTDAGVWVRALFDEGRGGPTSRRLVQEGVVDAPAHVDLEFLNAARRLVFAGRVTAEDAESGIRRFLQAPITRHSPDTFAWRIWALRDNVTAYDACYVALAETLASTLFTTDVRLFTATGVRCRVEVAGQ